MKSQQSADREAIINSAQLVCNAVSNYALLNSIHVNGTRLCFNSTLSYDGRGNHLGLSRFPLQPMARWLRHLLSWTTWESTRTCSGGDGSHPLSTAYSASDISTLCLQLLHFSPLSLFPSFLPLTLCSSFYMSPYSTPSFVHPQSFFPFPTPFYTSRPFALFSFLHPAIASLHPSFLSSLPSHSSFPPWNSPPV